LPENANMDDIRCSLGNGVLTVTVPKKEVTATRNKGEGWWESVAWYSMVYVP
ncbi:17.8 kDa class I heat shock protein, partial [Trichinella papuae]